MLCIKRLSAVVRGGDVAGVRQEDVGDYERGVGWRGEEIGHELAGDGARRDGPGARHVGGAGEVDRVREQGAIRSDLVEAHVRVSERGVRSRHHPRLAAVAPGHPVILGDEQTEVRPHEDPVRSVRGKVHAELRGERAVRARRFRSGQGNRRACQQQLEASCHGRCAGDEAAVARAVPGARRVSV